MSGVATAVVGGAVVGAGATYLAGKKQAGAIDDASKESRKAADQATALQREIWQKDQANMQPWLDQGTNALNQLAPGVLSGQLSRPFSMNDFQTDPGYQFRLSEGIKGLDRSASAQGNLLSGAALKGINRYSQDYASNEYQNAYNRFIGQQNTKYNQLANLAGVGQTSANMLGQSNQNYANNTGNIAMWNGQNQGNTALAQGNNSASMYQGYGNALSSMFTGLGQYYGRKV